MVVVGTQLKYYIVEKRDKDMVKRINKTQVDKEKVDFAGTNTPHDMNHATRPACHTLPRLPPPPHLIVAQLSDAHETKLRSESGRKLLERLAVKPNK